MFDGVPPKARRYAVVGWPLSHTLSPAMHNAAIRALGLNAAYRAVPVPPEEWDAFSEQARILLNGFNVTVPHKERAFRWKGLLPFSSENPWGLVGAVNTMVRRTKGWEAHNTDVPGFFEDCRDKGVSFSGKKVLLLGAGGAGRAILFGFHGREKPSRLWLMDQDQAKAGRLSEEVKKFDAAIPLERTRTAEEVLPNADVVINATPLGLKEGDPSPADPDLLRAGVVVYDLIYHRETALLKAAKAKNGKAFDGLGMLVNQGALAFELWFGEELATKAGYAPAALRRIMGDAARAAMNERGTS